MITIDNSLMNMLNFEEQYLFLFHNICPMSLCRVHITVVVVVVAVVVIIITISFIFSAFGFILVAFNQYHNENFAFESRGCLCRIKNSALQRFV